jgi:hypothetical protein
MKSKVEYPLYREGLKCRKLDEKLKCQCKTERRQCDTGSQRCILPVQPANSDPIIRAFDNAILENILLQHEAAELKEQFHQTTLDLERFEEELSRLRQELRRSRASTRTSDPRHESNQREPRPEASDIRSPACYEVRLPTAALRDAFRQAS